MAYDENPLNVGEFFTYGDGHGGQSNKRFSGLTENGEPGFTPHSLNITAVRFFSNTDYPDGTPWPAFVSDPYVSCFLEGTQIATRTGPVAVEYLRVGDCVLTAEEKQVPVKWIWRQTVHTCLGQSMSNIPILIHANALAAGLPVRDLRVTADHALLIDGALVQAGALVNGTTIRRMTAAELGARSTVFHVEMENHALILAEGVAAETFVDNVTRRRFNNYAEYEALYGEAGASIAELDLPRVKSARQLPAPIRQRLYERAAVVVGEPEAAAA